MTNWLNYDVAAGSKQASPSHVHRVEYWAINVSLVLKEWNKLIFKLLLHVPFKKLPHSVFCKTSVMQIMKNTLVISLALSRSLAVAIAVVFVFIEFGWPLKLFVFLRLLQIWFCMTITNSLVTARWLLIYREPNTSLLFAFAVTKSTFKSCIWQLENAHVQKCV